MPRRHSPSLLPDTETLEADVEVISALDEEAKAWIAKALLPSLLGCMQEMDAAALASISWSLAMHSGSLHGENIIGPAWAQQHSHAALIALERELGPNMKRNASAGSRSHVAATLVWSYARLGFSFARSSDSKLMSPRAAPGLLASLLKATMIHNHDPMGSTSHQIKTIRATDLSVACLSLLRMDADLSSIVDDNLVRQWLLGSLSSLLPRLQVPTSRPPHESTSLPRPSQRLAVRAKDTLVSLSLLIQPLLQDPRKDQLLQETLSQLSFSSLSTLTMALSSHSSPLPHLRDFQSALAHAAVSKLTRAKAQEETHNHQDLCLVLSTFASPPLPISLREEVKRAIVPRIISWLQGHREAATLEVVKRITSALVQVCCFPPLCYTLY